MTSPLLSLEPKHLWSHFDEICKIPRPSKHEEKIAEHVRNWAWFTYLAAACYQSGW